MYERQWTLNRYSKRYKDAKCVCLCDYVYQPALVKRSTATYQVGDHVRIRLDCSHECVPRDRTGVIYDITPEFVILVSLNGESLGDYGMIKILEIKDVNKISTSCGYCPDYISSWDGLRQVHCKDDM